MSKVAEKIVLSEIEQEGTRKAETETLSGENTKLEGLLQPIPLFKNENRNEQSGLSTACEHVVGCDCPYFVERTSWGQC